jgi:hypothetical protein
LKTEPLPLPEHCCQLHTGPLLVCEENRRRMEFRNPQRHPLHKCRIDSCAVPASLQPACDWLVIDHRQRGHFVELKGGDITRALQQLEASLHSFRAHLAPRETIHCWVIASSGRIPAASFISAQRRFKKKWNASLSLHARQHTFTLPD